ncbi:MAG: hypothetical protein DRO09_01515 [Thermoprotei archaeon]|nr:MAG: hypothetical protein DRO09_01515 [Thermoprotei archaeon]
MALPFNPLFIELDCEILSRSFVVRSPFNPLFIELDLVEEIGIKPVMYTFNPLFIETVHQPTKRLHLHRKLSILFSLTGLLSAPDVFLTFIRKLSILFSLRFDGVDDYVEVPDSPFNPLFIEIEGLARDTIKDS